jgi:hypothetical protein
MRGVRLLRLEELFDLGKFGFELGDPFFEIYGGWVDVLGIHG